MEPRAAGAKRCEAAGGVSAVGVIKAGRRVVRGGITEKKKGSKVCCCLFTPSALGVTPLLPAVRKLQK